MFYPNVPSGCFPLPENVIRGVLSLVVGRSAVYCSHTFGMISH